MRPTFRAHCPRDNGSTRAVIVLKTMLLAVAILLVSVAFCSASECSASPPIRVVSINVRVGSANDKENSWSKRKEFLLDLVKQEPYDFIGGQEVLIHPNKNFNQLNYLSKNLPEYGVVVRGREKNAKFGESSPVFYRKDRWQPDEKVQGTFWLSDTPEIPGSITWKDQSGCPRIATGALFHERQDGQPTGVKLFVYSTHFDHVGESARQKSAETILKRLLPLEGPPVPIVLMGDFNCGENSSAIRYLKGETVELAGKTCTPPLALLDTFRLVHPDEMDVATFHDFRGVERTRNRMTPNAKIDYIFVSPGVKCTEAEIIRTNKDGRYPTDHYPIRATIEVDIPIAF